MAHSALAQPLQVPRGSPSSCFPLAEWIASGDVRAAHFLYSKYARGIRALLRRRIGQPVLDEYVFEVLLGAARELRTKPAFSMRGVTAAVLRSLRAFSGRVHSNPDRHLVIQAHLTLAQRSTLMNQFLSGLTALERDILFRAYLLSQPDARISEETDVPENDVRNIRGSALCRFRGLTLERCSVSTPIH